MTLGLPRGALHSPSLEPLLSVTVRLDGIPRERAHLLCGPYMGGLFVQYGQLRVTRPERGGLLNLEVKVDDGFSIALCFRVLAAL